jgi:hypothetical protein
MTPMTLFSPPLWGISGHPLDPGHAPSRRARRDWPGWSVKARRMVGSLGNLRRVWESSPRASGSSGLMPMRTNPGCRSSIPTAYSGQRAANLPPGCFGPSDRSAQDDRCALRSITPKRATTSLAASVDHTDARKATVGRFGRSYVVTEQSVRDGEAVRQGMAVPRAPLSRRDPATPGVSAWASSCGSVRPGPRR